MAYAIQSKGATPGIVGKINNFLGLPNKSSNQNTSFQSSAPRAGVSSPQSLGSNPGMINQPKPQPTAPIAKTVDASGTTTHYATKSNPNVLSQQQALNKLGAGLVEDGIVGPKTREAISKYGSSGVSTPTPEKTASKTSQEKVTPPAPTANIDTPSGRTQGVLNTGQFTPTEQGLISGQNPYGQASQQSIKGLLDSQKQNQIYADRANEIATSAGNQISDIGRAGARGQAGYRTTGTSPVGEGNAAVLAQTTAAQQQAVSQGANMELAGNAQGLSAQGQAQAGLSSAAGNALSGQGQMIGVAQNQAGRAQGVAGQVFNAGLNQQGSFGAPAFNPLTGEYTSNGQFGGVDASSNIQSIKDFTSQINNIDSQSEAINNNFSRAINYATSAGLTGSSPILEGFKNRFGTGFLTNPAVVGFNQAIAALNTQLQSFGEQPIDINTATAQTLQQAQETVKKNLLTQKSNLQSTKDNLLNSGSSGSSTGGSGGQWDW